jgi:hypothetical protein
MIELLSQIEAFSAAHSLSEWQFGELALKDRHFVRQLREGRDIRLSTAKRVREFMSEYSGASRQEAASLPAASAPALCTICDLRLEDATIRACGQRDCPNAQKDAA